MFNFFKNNDKKYGLDEATRNRIKEEVLEEHIQKKQEKEAEYKISGFETNISSTEWKIIGEETKEDSSLIIDLVKKIEQFGYIVYRQYNGTTNWIVDVSRDVLTLRLKDVKNGDFCEHYFCLECGGKIDFLKEILSRVNNYKQIFDEKYNKNFIDIIQRTYNLYKNDITDENSYNLITKKINATILNKVVQLYQEDCKISIEQITNV